MFVMALVLNVVVVFSFSKPKKGCLVQTVLLALKKMSLFKMPEN